MLLTSKDGISLRLIICWLNHYQCFEDKSCQNYYSYLIGLVYFYNISMNELQTTKFTNVKIRKKMLLDCIRPSHLSNTISDLIDWEDLSLMKSYLSLPKCMSISLHYDKKKKSAKLTYLDWRLKWSYFNNANANFILSSLDNFIP